MERRGVGARQDKGCASGFTIPFPLIDSLHQAVKDGLLHRFRLVSVAQPLQFQRQHLLRSWGNVGTAKSETYTRLFVVFRPPPSSTKVGPKISRAFQSFLKFLDSGQNLMYALESFQRKLLLRGARLLP